ncbi:MAG: ribonuclease III [Pegethrix bostrychoides GSE-TBD4-15B]|jgi:ribonuclease-3|uniref:Ribonuclease 3 n=1 Tax=Pegethrix bostrychoides GSE-TBD4-15B TaxID=2839662 RepID=A0A951P809_9CYAN|nr:ribonuclease III [Pegethrix bostrychoides GSE-TBD4-15B]
MHPLLNFHNDRLLRQALTHRSYVNEHPGEQHNERLEFLGDALLTFISGDYLYHRYPDIAEDEMTRRRSALVDQQQLAEFAMQIGLATVMRLGKGAIQGGGFQNPNLLSSSFEAVIGAYYLDRNRDINAIRPIVEALFATVPASITEVRSHMDAKNRLQEWTQAEFGQLPRYVNRRVGGSDHAPEYLSSLFIGDQLLGEGRACGKKPAEKQAAEAALLRLKQQGLL